MRDEAAVDEPTVDSLVTAIAVHTDFGIDAPFLQVINVHGNYGGLLAQEAFLQLLPILDTVPQNLSTDVATMLLEVDVTLVPCGS